MLAAAAAAAILVGAEISGYAYHRRAYNFAQEKRYFDSPIDTDWIENFILNEMDVEELKAWISNSISYSEPKDDHQNNSDNQNNTDHQSEDQDKDQGEESIDDKEDNEEKKTKYYNNVPIEKIPRSKMLKWTCYYLYFKSMWQIDKEQIERGEQVLKKIEERIGITFKDDDELDTDSKEIFFLKFGNNRFECSYRPVIAYAGLSVMKHISYAKMRWNGFTMHTMEKSGMKYFYFQNPEFETNEATMFVHGLGIGITPYMSYLTELKTLGNVIVPILPNVSNMEHKGMFSSIDEDTFFPSYETIRYDFNKMLETHGIEQVDVIGHSFGTIVMGILLKSEELSQKMRKKVFVDPVCFIDRSFKIFRYINEPKGEKKGIVDNVFNLIVYNDLHVRYVSQRFLYGPEFWILDYSKLNNDTLLVLSNEDSMVPSQSIYDRCKKYGVSCIRVSNAHHADIFLLDEYKGVWNTIKSFFTINVISKPKLELVDNEEIDLRGLNNRRDKSDELDETDYNNYEEIIEIK